MEASSAVALAQIVSLELVKKKEIPAPQRFSDALEMKVQSKGIRVPYMDDLNTIGARKRIVNRSIRRISSRLAQNGLPCNEKDPR